MEAKIESKSTYDDRKKELTHTTSEEREAKIGEEKIGDLLITSKGIYNEAGIRKILKDLGAQKEVHEKNIVNLKEVQEKAPEMTPELKSLKGNLKILQLIDHKEKASEADIKKEVDDLKQSEEDLKKVKKDIQDIKDAIGSRLKF